MNPNLGKRLDMVLMKMLGKKGPHRGAKPQSIDQCPFCLHLGSYMRAPYIPCNKKTITQSRQANT